MGQIAFLMLMGIVMKNGVLRVDYTNTQRARTPLGQGDGSEWRAPMGIVSIGGLTASTFLTPSSGQPK